MNKITNLKYSILSVCSFALLAVSNVSALTAPTPVEWTGTDVGVAVAKIATTIFNWGGAICVLMIVIGALVYMTAGEDTKKVEGGKTIVKAALIGFAILLACTMLVSFVQNLSL